jgi:hypothetical protein
MPSANRLAFVRDGVRNHPVMVATSAATIGVLLGGFVAVQALAPVKPKAEASAPQQVVAKVQPAATSAAETTGSAPSGDSVASAPCDKETWPYLSRTCADQLRNKPRGPRVIATDKLDKSTVTAMEAQPLQPPAPPITQAPAAPAIASTTPSAAVAQPATPPAPAIASTPPPAAASAPSASVPSPAATAVAPVAAPPEPAKTEVAETPQQQPIEAKADLKKDKRVAKKAKRKARPAVQPDADDDDTNAVASNESGARATNEDQSDSRTYRRSGKRPHIVARWIERVPADDGDGERQITVRRGGRGLFETLFGVGRANADDD